MFHFTADNKWTLEILENVKPPKTKPSLNPKIPTIRLQNLTEKSVVNVKKNATKNAKKSIKFVKKVVASNIPKQNSIKQAIKSGERTIATSEELSYKEDEDSPQPLPKQPTEAEESSENITMNQPREEKLAAVEELERSAVEDDLVKAVVNEVEKSEVKEEPEESDMTEEFSSNAQLKTNTRTICGLIVITAGITIFTLMDIPSKCEIFSAFDL